MTTTSLFDHSHLSRNRSGISPLWWTASAAAILIVAGLGSVAGQIILPPPITVTVNSTADTDDARIGDGICADSNGQCTLRAAIETVNNYFSRGANTIKFNIPTSDPGYNAGSGASIIVVSVSLPDITSSVSITGPGAGKLSIQPFSVFCRIFNVTTSGTVNLSGLTLRNAVVSDGGGALQNLKNGIINVTHCAFTNNVSNGQTGGGAIYNGIGGTINIASSRFQYNVASGGSQGQGGAILNNGWQR